MRRDSTLTEAIAPAGFMRRAVAYSLFIADGGLYMIRTGNGWRMNVRGLARNELMAAEARRVEATIDPENLAEALATREGSVFIPGGELSIVVLGSRFDGNPDLRFVAGASKFRVQFDDDRRADVEAFVANLLATFPSISAGDQRKMLSFEEAAVETVAWPSPCWGATPHVAVADGRLFVEYVAPTGRRHAEMSVVYRSSDDEQVRFAAGDLDLLELCQRLVSDVWGSTPPPATGD